MKVVALREKTINNRRVQVVGDMEKPLLGGCQLFHL
jgi:hypothetical protein